MEAADRRIAELHLAQARNGALRLFCTSSAIFPDEWGGSIVNESLHIDLTSFALHARRVSELCGFSQMKFAGVATTRFRISDPPDLVLIADYNEALNRLVHARRFIVGYAVWDGTKIWLNSANDKVVSYVAVETDRRPRANLSVFGLATCFLSEVLIAVKTSFPELCF